MILLSIDPSGWPDNDTHQVATYVLVASSTAILYDWALTFRQEVELIWTRRWSFMTLLYVIVRYVGILYSINNLLPSLPGISMTDVVIISCQRLPAMPVQLTTFLLRGTLFFLVQAGTYFVINTILGIIMIARLYAMYQGSKKILVFLIAVFPTITAACGVLSVLAIRTLPWDDLVLSGTHQCVYEVQKSQHLELLLAGVWILRIVWEGIVLCLAAWITVKHFHDNGWQFPRWPRGDCFTVLIETHVLYFATFAAVSCFSLGCLSPNIIDSYSVGAQIYYAILQIAIFVQLFVLGPRLILSVRGYNDKLTRNSELATCMSSIAFQEESGLVSVSTSTSSV